jgi:hypothetical protein
MRTTAGVTTSARFTNASLRSIAGFTAASDTCGASTRVGMACVVSVQPSPLARPRPKRKATMV